MYTACDSVTRVVKIYLCWGDKWFLWAFDRNEITIGSATFGRKKDLVRKAELRAPVLEDEKHPVHARQTFIIAFLVFQAELSAQHHWT